MTNVYQMPGVPDSPPSGRKSRWWIWLIVGGSVLVLSCIGCIGIGVIMLMRGPDTSVYTGNAVPKRFTDTMKQVGALDDDERIIYFYSDAMIDIRDGFYFVSDKRVVIYSTQWNPTLTSIRLDEIIAADLYREESFFTDSELVVTLDDGTTASFPVSSEADGDVRFHEAIETRITAESK